MLRGLSHRLSARRFRGFFIYRRDALMFFDLYVPLVFADGD
jgi:hypothetical protein